MNKKIGIIGGMGPMATQVFYKMVTENTLANKDQDHVNMIILSDPQIPDRTEAILSGKDTKQYKEVIERLLADSKFLQTSGCEAIAITCNTAHYFVNLIEEEIDIPIINMIKETASEVAMQFVSGCKPVKIGILATNGTIKTELYQKALELEGLVPYIITSKTQELVMHEIYDCIKKGNPYDAGAWQVIEQELITAGCSKALLACTELSVIKEENNLSEFYIDPLKILAYRVITFSGRQIKCME